MVRVVSGIDIDPSLIAQAQASAQKAGVAALVTFRVQDAMTVDVSEATVVTLYLLARLEREAASDPHPSS
jgi:23S rRNA G2445 N2-methylase RlmL